MPLRLRTACSVATTCIVSGLLACAPGERQERAPEWNVTAESLVTIGETAGAAEVLFERIAFARLLERGRIVVADGGPPALRVYGPDGTFQVEIGGAGEGPGEFQSIRGLWTAGDTVGVFDSRLRRLVTYLTDGTHLSTVSLTVPNAAPDGLLDFLAGRFRDGSVAVAWTVADRSTPLRVTPDRTVLGRFGPDGRFLDTIGEGGGLERYDRTVRPLSGYPRAAVLGDSLYFTDGYGGRIRIWSAGGGEGRSVDLPLPVVSVRDAMAALEAKLGPDASDPVGTLLADVPAPDSLPRIGGLSFDDRGALWAKPYVPGVDALWVGGGARPRGPTWAVFDRAGLRLATVTIPGDLVVLDVRDDRLLGLTLDRLDVERVVVHAIVR